MLNISTGFLVASPPVGGALVGVQAGDKFVRTQDCLASPHALPIYNWKVAVAKIFSRHLVLTICRWSRRLFLLRNRGRTVLVTSWLQGTSTLVS